MNLLLFAKRKLTAGIALALNFTSGETLDSRVTFSRTSNATRVNAQGLIEYAPHNLLTYSENFDNAAWTMFRASITANTVTAPDGTLTGDKLVEDTSATSTHGTNRTQTLTDNLDYSFSCFIKAGERSIVRMQVLNKDNTVCLAYFDTSTGVVSNASNATGTMTLVGNGWYRCVLVFNASTGGTTPNFLISPAIVAGTPFYTGDGTSGIYLWGAQLNIGSLQPYYTTSVKNLLGYSQDFTNAAWTKSNSSIDATPVMGPFGYLGAMKLVENTAASVPHGFAVDTISLNSTTQYTFSIYAKAGERTWVRLGLVDNLGTDGGRAWFDLSNGVVGTVDTNGAGSNLNATITSIGAGWYRCRFTAQMNNSKTTLQSQVRLATDNNVLTYTGDGTSGIYIYGAQLSDSASLDPYSYNTGAAPTSSAYYGPRFDYDPVTLAPKGLLIEEQRINYIRNNTMQGAVVGVPGTLPTNYVHTGGGLVTNVIGIGEENGIKYVDIQFVGTATSGSSGLRFEGNAGVSASTGQIWNTSLYIRKIAGTTSGLSSISTNLTYLVSGAGSDSITDQIPLPTLNLTSIIYNRPSSTLTAVTAGITAVRPQLLFGHSIGNNVDITLRIGMPQLEQGAFATSVIPTTSAQVTRTADNASMTGTNFSSWYNQSEGTVACESLVTGVRTSDYTYWRIDDNTSTNRIQSGTGASVTVGNAFIITNNISQGNNIVNVNPTNITKTAFAIATNNTVNSANGTIGTVDTTATLPTVNQLLLGRDSTVGYINGYIKSFKYFNKRFINTYLQRLTQ